MRVAVMNHEIRIFIEDSGPGVPLSKRNELFSKYQVSLDLLNQGTGLGLNLSKKLMDSLDGDIWLDDSYDSRLEGCPGPCFVVQLNTVPLDVESTLPPSDTDSYNNSHMSGPTDEGATEKPTDPPRSHTVTHDKEPTDDSKPAGVLISQEPPNTISPSIPSGSTPEPPSQELILPEDISVLFVDDDAVLRKLFMRGIRRVAPTWKIQEASSGETALQLCEANNFDLIFMDQYMASVEKRLLGTETVAAMRSNCVASAICGLSANDIRDSFLGAGANDFVLKPMPCKPDSLRAMLAKILEHTVPSS